MTIRKKELFGEAIREHQIEDLIFHDEWHEGGAIETLDRKAENVAKVLGRLIETMKERGLINDNEIGDILGCTIEEAIIER